MKTKDNFNLRRVLAVLTAGLAVGGMFAASARADMYRMSLNSGGGIPAQSLITSQTLTSSNCTISWYGLQGWYAVQATTNLSAGPWTSLTTVPASDFAWSATVPLPDP